MPYSAYERELSPTTILLLPITTALFPEISTPEVLMSSTQPSGVHGIIQSKSPLEIRPALIQVNPSTS